MKDMTDAEFKVYEERKRKELKTESKRREDVRIAEQRKKNASLVELIKGNPSFLRFVKHTRTSCSDENPNNGYEEDRGYARCSKCHLIEILQSDDDGFEISLGLTITSL